MLLLISCVRPLAAQDAASDSNDVWFLRGGIARAHILFDNPFEVNAPGPGASIDWIPDVTIEVGRQTSGSQEWHHLYGLPAYGIGFSLARFQGQTTHGRPLEAYGFFSWPFYQVSRRTDLITDFGMGLSWNWQQVNDQTRATRIALGSDVNARIDWGVYLRYRAAPRLSIYSGLDLTHRSNGGLVQPDEGVNVIGPRISAQYNFAPQPKLPSLPTPMPFRSKWEVLVGGATGFKNVVEDGAPAAKQDFRVFHATAAVQNLFYRYGKIAGGADLTYDGATAATGTTIDGAIVHSRADAGERWRVGVYGGYEHVIARFGAFIHLGYGLGADRNAVRSIENGAGESRFFQRFGWRYRITDRLWGMMALRSISGQLVADYVELGAGYRLPLNGK